MLGFNLKCKCLLNGLLVCIWQHSFFVTGIVQRSLHSKSNLFIDKTFSNILIHHPQHSMLPKTVGNMTVFIEWSTSSEYIWSEIFLLLKISNFFFSSTLLCSEGEKKVTSASCDSPPPPLSALFFVECQMEFIVLHFSAFQFWADILSQGTYLYKLTHGHLCRNEFVTLTKK